MSIDLRAERRNRGLLLKDVAAELDMSIGLLSMVERGERRPSPPLALRIAAFYGHEIPDVWPDFGSPEREAA